jgi:hypothetical protein
VVLLAKALIQFAMCGKTGKLNPYSVVEALDRQKILLFINSVPSDIATIAEKLRSSKARTAEELQALKECGLIKEVNARYSPVFPIFTLKDLTILAPLVEMFGRGVSDIIGKRMREVRDLVSDLACSKTDLSFCDMEYIIIGAMTLDYNGLRVMKDAGLLCPGKMPGGGNYVFLGLESRCADLKEGWMWGHSSTFGKYSFNTHGKLPLKGFRMAFPDITWNWAELAERDIIAKEMEKIGEILESLSQKDLTVMELKAKTGDPGDKLLAELTMLFTLGYIVPANKKWRINRPFFFPDDMRKIRKLSDSILSEVAKFFKREQSQMLNVYMQTSPSKNNLAFEESFNLLYHLIFEKTLNILMEKKMITMPPERQDNVRYSPFVGIAIEEALGMLALDQ